MALTRLPNFTLLSTDSFTFGNANVTGNVTVGNILTDHLLYANGAAWTFGGTYTNTNVSSYLSTFTGLVAAGNVTATGNVTAAYLIGNGSQLTGLPASYTNTNVSSYLATFTGNIAANIITASGNITSAGIVTSGTSGNLTGANYVVANYFTGTLTTGAQPNITSVGTLVSANVTGNISSAANVTAAYLIGNGSQLTGLPASYTNTNVSSYLATFTGLVAAGNVTATGNVTASYFIGNGSQLTGLPASYANSNVASYLPTYTGSYTGNTIVLTGTPITYSAYMNGSSYVVVPGTGLLPTSGSYTIEFWMKTNDTSFEIFASEVSGLAIFISSSNFYYQYNYGTGGPITVSASSILDNNWHHVALVRNSTTVTLYFDGVSKGTASDNTDYSSYNAYNYDIGYGNQSGGRYLTGYLSNFRVVNGTAVYTSNFTPPTSPLTAITGTTLLTFQNSTLIDNSSLAKSLTVSGTVTYGSAVIPFSGLVGGNITATGNISGNYFIGNGSQLTGTIANANYAAYAGNVINAAQSNITSVGTLTSITTSGDGSIGGNLTVTGNLTVSGTTTTVNSTTVNINDINIVLANNATTAAQANGAGITINGADANMIYNSTSNAFVFSHKISADGSLLTSINGSNVTGTVASATAATTAGTVTTAAQPNITSIGTLTSLNVTGNISSAANVTASYLIGNGSQLTGTIPTANYAAYAGNVTVAAQPNITSVGTLASVSVTANVTAGNLLTDHLYYSNGAAWSFGGNPGGSNTYLQFNDSSSFGGSSSLTFDKVTTRLTANNFTATSSANLGAVGNVIITGGSSGQVLQTDGSGTLSWSTMTAANITVDTFTGDGSTVQFTLSVSPANANVVTVNYNGATLLHETYSISGANITFVEAPANGYKFDVTTVNAGASGGSSGASRVQSTILSMVFGG